MSMKAARGKSSSNPAGEFGNSSGASVRLRNLSRSFGTVRALAGLNLDLAPGELVALLGPSGCGKTTALRMVAGFETADSGTVEEDGQDVSPVPAAKRDMGMVFQSYSLFPNMSALDNVGFGPRMRKLGGTERGRRARELLDMVGLGTQAGQYPPQLSGGQPQRIPIGHRGRQLAGVRQRLHHLQAGRVDRLPANRTYNLNRANPGGTHDR